MKHPSKPLAITLTLILVALSTAIGAIAQERVSTQERRVLVWRGQGDQIVEIQASPGRRGYLGITMLDLTEELREHFGVPLDRGVMVSRVISDSPADHAGLEAADIVTAIETRPVSASIDLSMALGGAEEGDVLTVEYWREGLRAAVDVPIVVNARSRVDIAPLIERRISIDSPEVLRLHEADPHLAVDKVWLEQVVGRMSEHFSEAGFREQLEAMRLERNNLSAKLLLMEERLEELEGELQRLVDER